MPCAATSATLRSQGSSPQVGRSSGQSHKKVVTEPHMSDRDQRNPEKNLLIMAYWPVYVPSSEGIN